MSRMNDGNKYIFKLTALIIVIIINIIAVTAVITTVGRTIKNLKNDLSNGKITVSKENQNQNQNQTQQNELDGETEQGNFTDENELDFGDLLKMVMADKNARKSIILMIISLVLLATAIFILIKLK